MKKSLLALFCAALILPACTTYDAYTGEEKTTNTAKGAAIGASVAAVAAYIANKDEKNSTRNKRILAASAGGAAIGGGIGYYMDSQEAKLRKQLRSTGVSVIRDGDNITLVMPGNITFASNSGDINASFYEVLNSVAIVLEEFDKTIVAVAGYTDSTGSTAYNQGLSERRAQSVATYLQSRGIIADRFDVIGFGEQHPIADNNTASGRELNRRVEITLLPVSP
jgi:outer membrane protein OmpA-like peptidoglycan-associated protein